MYHNFNKYPKDALIYNKISFSIQETIEANSIHLVYHGI